MRFTTRQFIRAQCALADIREALAKHRPAYVYFSTQYFGAK